MNKAILFMLATMVVLVTLQVGFVSAAVTECLTEYTYNDTGVPTNVSAGNVCFNATEYDVQPDAVTNCGTWSECTADACTALEYYVGYAGDGTVTCVATDWVATGTSYDPADGEIINVTENVDTCSVTTTGETATYDACVNEYTRQGPDGYCDGAGVLDTDDALLNVTAGDVCVAGVNLPPNSTISCSDSWASYVDGTCNYTSYYVGYAADGSGDCIATDWVQNVASVFIAADYIINTTVDGLISADYVTNVGETATYDACPTEYTRQGPDGYCDGAGVLDTDDATTNVTEGNVCYLGTDANPNATTNCGTWSECVLDATTADEYYVGYTDDGLGVCIATGWVAAGTTFTTETGQEIRTTENVDTCDVKGYATTYVDSDLKLIVEDGLGTAGAETVSWLDLIILALILVFIVGIFMRFKGMW